MNYRKKIMSYKLYFLITTSVFFFLTGCGDSCETAKGTAIEKCMSMKPGMEGMASCNGAVASANSACKRTDLTIQSIMNEASKGSSK